MKWSCHPSGSGVFSLETTLGIEMETGKQTKWMKTRGYVINSTYIQVTKCVHLKNSSTTWVWRCVNNGSSVPIFEAIEHVFEPSCFAPLFALVRRLVALIPLTVVVQHDPSNACSVSLLQLLGFFSVSNFAFKYVSGCVRHFPSTVSTFYTLSNCHELPMVPFTPLQVSIDSQLRDLENQAVRQCPAMRFELLIQRHVWKFVPFALLFCKTWQWKNPQIGGFTGCKQATSRKINIHLVITLVGRYSVYSVQHKDHAENKSETAAQVETLRKNNKTTKPKQLCKSNMFELRPN